MPKQWIIPPPSNECAAAAQRWSVAPLVAQVLLNRGLIADEPCTPFLVPQLKDLHPPESLPGAPQAAEMLAEAARRGTRIVVYGDYDVDGTTGVAILWHALRLAGADVGFYVPHRLDEGYGLNLSAIKRLVDEGAGLIVTVDCGITAAEEAAWLRSVGVPLIVTDHHTYRDALPPADVIVHPGLGDTYPNPDLCGAGVAFKLAWMLGLRLAGAGRVDPTFRTLLTELLPLAALGTIADVVPLRGENRVIAKHGLERLPTTKLAGLKALIDSTGLADRKIDGFDVGFKLAPRINAAGRMGHARLAVELFTRADANRAREIALYLEEHNRSRRATEQRITKEVCARIDQDGLASDARRAIVLASEGWHAGVIGIVAARVVDRYHRPAVVIAVSNGEGQGSARSIAGFDLADALAACSDHLITFGGHRMAAGLRVTTDRVDAFTEAFVDVANRRLTARDLVDTLRLDAEVSLDVLTLPCTEALLALGPFGIGNPRPRLATGWLELAAEPRCVGRNGDHLQAVFRKDGTQIKAIGFGMGSMIEDLKERRGCRAAFAPIVNEFNGRRSVEMQLIDLHFED